jgi:GrpB-like predicted nucleotidyltransferase (UPF0157 family)
MTTPVEIIEYDERYPCVFAAVRKSLASALPRHADIEHVGSTAVPGLGGKPIIDMLVTAEKPYVGAVVNMLEGLGYTFDPKISTTRDKPFLYGTCQQEGCIFRVHVHVTHHGSKHRREMLLLRDYMKAHLDEAERYFGLKREWATKAGADRGEYTRLKTTYIRSVVAKAAEEMDHGSGL